MNQLAAALADRYTVERELGQGGMATVYLARDLKHDRQVALKVLRPELAAILGRDRFLAEIRLTAKLDHPHILTLLDSGESDGLLWYTLPYIRGESLRHKLDRELQLGVAEALSITHQVAGALDYAHQQGIIHRDVKPENILLHEGEAMLADFGIALAVREAGGRRLTETGLSLGTPQYMSPEQATAERALDARSDIYSLGAVLYEMLAGEPPHSGPSAQAVIARLMTERPTPLRTLRDTVPPGVEAAVTQALAKAPADRFPSAAAFAEALTAPETHRAPRRMPVRRLAGAAAGVAALAAGVWLLPQLRSGSPPSAPVEPTLTQVTFSGNALGPALSPDGRQLAYALETCRSANNACSGALVVEDLASGERRTLADGFEGRMYRLTWSPDQRYLLVNAVRAGQDGLHLASVFSGGVRYLGHYTGGQFLGTADTIVARMFGGNMEERNPGLADRWFPVLSADGAVRDSIPFKVAGVAPWPLPSPDGRRLLIWSYSGDATSGQSLYLIDRAGRLTDSLPTLRGFHAHVGLQWTASGDGVLATVAADSTTLGIRTLLRFRISPEGKVRLPPDTLARRLRLPIPGWKGIGFSPPARSGTIALTLGEHELAITTLERPSRSAPPERRAKLVTSTGSLQGWISPDGERVLAAQQVTLDGRTATRLEVWPFAGGTGTPLGPPLQRLGSIQWGADSRTIHRFVRASREFQTIDAANGRTVTVRTVPDSVGGLGLAAFQPWSARGWMLYSSSTADQQVLPLEWRAVSPSGDSVLSFSFPERAPWINAVIVGPDGRGAWYGAVITSSRLGDTLYTLYVARPGVPARNAMQFSGPWGDVTLLRIAPGPAFDIYAHAIGGGGSVVHLEPGRPPRDDGPLPAWPNFSADGRRGVVHESELRTDIWLLTWPGGDSTGTGGAR